MIKLKKPAGAYLIGVAVMVSAFFITNPLITGLLDTVKVWAALDILLLPAWPPFLVTSGPAGSSRRVSLARHRAVHLRTAGPGGED